MPWVSCPSPRSPRTSIGAYRRVPKLNTKSSKEGPADQKSLRAFRVSRHRVLVHGSVSKTEAAGFDSWDAC